VKKEVTFLPTRQLKSKSPRYFVNLFTHQLDNWFRINAQRLIYW